MFLGSPLSRLFKRAAIECQYMFGDRKKANEAVASLIVKNFLKDIDEAMAVADTTRTIKVRAPIRTFFAGAEDLAKNETLQKLGGEAKAMAAKLAEGRPVRVTVKTENGEGSKSPTLKANICGMFATGNPTAIPLWRAKIRHFGKKTYG